jgi:hypothetical protein
VLASEFRIQNSDFGRFTFGHCSRTRQPSAASRGTSCGLLYGLGAHEPAMASPFKKYRVMGRKGEGTFSEVRGLALLVIT